MGSTTINHTRPRITLVPSKSIKKNGACQPVNAVMVMSSVQIKRTNATGIAIPVVILASKSSFCSICSWSVFRNESGIEHAPQLAFVVVTVTRFFWPHDLQTIVLESSILFTTPLMNRPADCTVSAPTVAREFFKNVTHHYLLLEPY